MLFEEEFVSDGLGHDEVFSVLAESKDASQQRVTVFLKLSYETESAQLYSKLDQVA